MLQSPQNKKHERMCGVWSEFLFMERSRSFFAKKTFGYIRESLAHCITSFNSSAGGYISIEYKRRLLDLVLTVYLHKYSKPFRARHGNPLLKNRGCLVFNWNRIFWKLNQVCIVKDYNTLLLWWGIWQHSLKGEIQSPQWTRSDWLSLPRQTWYTCV